MKMLIMAISYFFTSSVFSNEINDVVSVISKINTGTLVQVPQAQCLANLVMTSDSQKAPRSELYNKCAIDLCGPVNKNKSVWVTDEKFLPNASSDLIKKLDTQNPLFSRVFDKAIKTKLNEVQVIKDFLKNGSNNLSSLGPEKRELLDSLMFDQYLKKSVYQKEPPDKRLQITLVPPPNASSDFLKALKNYAKNLQESIVFDPNSKYFKSIYSEQDLAIIAKNSLNAVKNISRNNSNSSLAVRSEIMHYEQILSRSDVSRMDYISSLTAMRELNRKLSANNQASAFNKPTCQINECQKVYRDFFTNPQLVKKVSEYENILKAPKTKNQAIAKCKASIIVAETKSSDLKKAKDVFITAKKNIIKNMLPKFSSHSRTIVMDYLNNKLEFSNQNIKLQIASTDFVKYFSDSAKEYLKNNTIDISNSNSNILESIFVLENSFSDINPIGQIEPCSIGGPPSNAWDVYLPIKLITHAKSEVKEQTKNFKRKDHVIISDFSCQHADHGKHNTAHEIGHGLNYLFLTTKLSQSSAAIYNQMRSCSTNNYVDEMNVDELRTHEGDRAHTEEDTADIIAFMSDPADKKIYSCQFLEHSMTTNSYTNLKFIDEFDTRHSTGFSRTILEAVNKNVNLPESCLQLIKQEKPLMRFNKCI